MTTLHIDKSGPFTHAPTSVQQTMWLVIAALVPATLFDVWLFGWPALFLFLLTVGFCVAVEAICLNIAGKPLQPTITDGSAVLTGWLMAMSLPPWAPWWVAMVGAVFAVALAKHAFGGLGQNVFNPAMVGRVALLISFPVQMTAFVAPKPLFANGSPGFLDSLAITFGKAFDVDTMTMASALGHVKTELTRNIPVTESIAKVPALGDMLIGAHAGSFGETSAVLILAGGLFLMYRRIISWHIPAAVFGSLFVIATLANFIDPGRYAPGWFHITSGATFLGAFFIATDYVTSPVAKQGQIVFGIGIGVLTWIIRTYAGYPEGMAFAVLLMNSLSPIIDHHYRPRAFGRTRKGEPLPLDKGAAP